MHLLHWKCGVISRNAILSNTDNVKYNTSKSHCNAYDKITTATVMAMKSNSSILRTGENCVCGWVWIWLLFSNTSLPIFVVVFLSHLSYGNQIRWVALKLAAYFNCTIVTLLLPNTSSVPVLPLSLVVFVFCSLQEVRYHIKTVDILPYPTQCMACNALVLFTVLLFYLHFFSTFHWDFGQTEHNQWAF